MRSTSVYKCFYCGRQLSRTKKTRDHKLPRSRGGGNGRQNIVDACKPCNGDKGSLLLDEYRQVAAFRLGVDPRTFLFPGEAKLGDDAYKRRLSRARRGGQPPQPQPAPPQRSCDHDPQGGVCCYCADRRPIVPETGYCADCAEKASGIGRRRREHRKKLGRCITCGSGTPADGLLNCASCVEEYRELHRRNKRKCFDHYGRSCACCGLAFDERFLTLDRAGHGGPAGSLYRWAVDNNYPDSVRAVCWNCDMGRAANGGTCPCRALSGGPPIPPTPPPTSGAAG